MLVNIKSASWKTPGDIGNKLTAGFFAAPKIGEFIDGETSPSSHETKNLSNKTW
jgi:hypothetical protein